MAKFMISVFVYVFFWVNIEVIQSIYVGPFKHRITRHNVSSLGSLLAYSILFNGNYFVTNEIAEIKTL